MTNPIAAEANFLQLAKETPRVRECVPIQTAEREQAAAFEALVHRQTGFVFRVAHALLRNAGDAEDVVQEVFLKKGPPVPHVLPRSTAVLRPAPL